MLYIVSGNATIATWHVGEPAPLGRVDVAAAIHRVDEVQADGDELEYITNFFSVPRVNKLVVRWYGDDAKFIVGNLG